MEHPSLYLTGAHSLCTGKKISQLSPEKIFSTSEISSSDPEVQGPSTSYAHQDVFVQPNPDINIINESLTIISVSPIISKKKAHGSYMENKVKRQK